MHFTTPYEYTDLFIFSHPTAYLAHITAGGLSAHLVRPLRAEQRAIINADLSSFKAWEINFSLCCISTLFFFSNLS